MRLGCKQNKSGFVFPHLFSQIRQRPKFFYFQPLIISDEEFPQQILQIPSYAQFTVNMTRGIGSEQQYQDLSSTRQIAGPKYHKATFIKMKSKNYSRYYKTIIKCIGKGSYGTVRKVQSIISKEFRAAKIIKKNSMKESQLQKLSAQVYIMMQLDHPHIVNILEVFNYKNQLTLICQLCQGGDLLKYIKSKKKNKHEKIIANVIKQLLKAVIYLHNIGIVHRDIKPQNILFQNNHSHKIKLIDFGIATKMQPGEILTTRVGTPVYLAPQIIFEKYTEKVDVWAIGVTMYHLLSGKVPFRGDCIQQIMFSIVKNQIQFQSQVWKKMSVECVEVINLMTTKDYLSRPSAKEIFEHPYFQKIGDMQLTEDQKAEFASNIRKLQFKNKLQAAIQTFIVSQLLSMEEKSQLVQFFNEFDKDSDGVINTQQLKTALEQRKKISKQRIETLMEIIDTNGSGKIQYTQFLAAGFVDAKSFTVERLKQAFVHFDTNGNGRISFEEVMQFMDHSKQQQEQLYEIFNEYDINGDGAISQDQFINLMLERSKYINLSKLKQTPKQTQMRTDNIKLDIIISLNYAIPKGETDIFFKNLTNSTKVNVQKPSILRKLV